MTPGEPKTASTFGKSVSLSTTYLLQLAQCMQPAQHAAWQSPDPCSTHHPPLQTGSHSPCRRYRLHAGTSQ